MVLGIIVAIILAIVGGVGYGIYRMWVKPVTSQSDVVAGGAQ
jgi:hypothetical protein